ncbi:Actin-3 [Tritrichomonas foetus]|uniref:Actin-3 n=1 Tax=Tritrichomonas foetus TaxID=1144522 RepID=A0A1J4L4L7_9EUKA|nr:Actin-3 [Tritrichomonas foetus]|eukprot:OHT16916.1 Actin-3 [Tritrichomonas foetus]
MSETPKVIVIDTGSGDSKVGFAGENAPLSVFPTITGRPKFIFATNSDLSINDIFVGSDAQEQGGLLAITRPIEQGEIVNFDDLELIYNHIFEKVLSVDPSEYGVLVTDSPAVNTKNHENSEVNSNTSKNRLAQLMFEKFKVKNLFVASQPTMSLLSVGQKTGVVVDSGYNSTRVSAVIDGVLCKESSMTLNIGGLNLTKYLQKILAERCIDISDLEVVKDIKEKAGYVANDFDAEITKSQTSADIDFSYTLPDGKVITLSNERFRCPELLFKPHFNGFSTDGIDQIIVDSISNCKLDQVDGQIENLYLNIFLFGGSTLFKGLTERIEKSIRRLAPNGTIVKASATPERRYSVWSGGSVFASMSSYEQTAISNKEYQEQGFDAVARNCV